MFFFNILNIIFPPLFLFSLRSKVPNVFCMQHYRLDLNRKVVSITKIVFQLNRVTGHMMRHYRRDCGQLHGKI